MRQRRHGLQPAWVDTAWNMCLNPPSYQHFHVLKKATQSRGHYLEINWAPGRPGREGCETILGVNSVRQTCLPILLLLGKRQSRRSFDHANSSSALVGYETLQSILLSLDREMVVSFFPENLRRSNDFAS